MNLGERIYKFRTAKNMSQGDLADALEVSRQSVSKWENNTAVPELDKIVKMARLFGVSLDELIAGAEPAATSVPPVRPEPEIHTVYVEKQVPMPFSGVKLLGGALLVVSLVLLILLTVVEECELIESLLLLSPVIAVGLVCLTAKQPLLWSLWCCAGGYWLYVFLLTWHWENEIFLLILGGAFVVALLIWTARKQKKGEISIPSWVWVIGILLLLAATALLIVNLFHVGNSGMIVPAIPGVP
jgi:DNA-binding XRE family transcriptional regulator